MTWRGIDPRRFWNGEPIIASKINAPFFENLERKIWTATYEKESRDSIQIAPHESVVFHLASFDEGERRAILSFAFEGAPHISEGVQVYIDNEKCAELLYLVPQRWHNATVKINSKDTELRIANTCSSWVFFAHPIFQIVSSQKRRTLPPRNIIVLLLDALSQDALGSYNPSLVQYTPNITRFFEKGIRYTNAITQSEWTLPSVHSFLTSRYSIDHGMLELRSDNPNMKPEKAGILPQRMRSLGYMTMAYSTVKVFHPAFFAHIGFDRFFYAKPSDQSSSTSKEICAQAIAQLMRNHSGKNFLFLHFLDSHEPWIHPSDMEESLLPNFRITDPMQEENHYIRGYGDTKAEPILDDDGISILHKRRNARLVALDASLQTLFDYIETSGQREETAVILISDHGPLYVAKKKPLLCDTRVTVPFLISCSGMTSRVCSDLVAINIDLAPTLLKIAGETYMNTEGSIIPPFGDIKHSFVISESIFGKNYKAAIRDHDYVYHYACLYNEKQRKIHFNVPRGRFLFERKNEQAALDLAARLPERVAVMHNLLLQHVGHYPTMSDLSY